MNAIVLGNSKKETNCLCQCKNRPEVLGNEYQSTDQLTVMRADGERYEDISPWSWYTGCTAGSAFSIGNESCPWEYVPAIPFICQARILQLSWRRPCQFSHGARCSQFHNLSGTWTLFFVDTGAIHVCHSGAQRGRHRMPDAERYTEPPATWVGTNRSTAANAGKTTWAALHGAPPAYV